MVGATVQFRTKTFEFSFKITNEKAKNSSMRLLSAPDIHCRYFRMSNRLKRDFEPYNFASGNAQGGEKVC